MDEAKFMVFSRRGKGPVGDFFPQESGKKGIEDSPVNSMEVKSFRCLGCRMQMPPGRCVLTRQQFHFNRRVAQAESGNGDGSPEYSASNRKNFPLQVRMKVGFGVYRNTAGSLQSVT
jgi:hypothetical protein